MCKAYALRSHTQSQSSPTTGQGALEVLWHSLLYCRMSAAKAGEVDSVAVDAYVLDTLMRDLIGHDRAPSAFVVYLFLWRRSVAIDAASTQVSLRDIAEGTGLSKRGIQEALTILARRKLVSIARRSLTDVPVYTVMRPWRRRVG
jgi:hypothetical protein